MPPEHEESPKRPVRTEDLDAHAVDFATGRLNDAYMIASLVLAEKISPFVAASLIATLSHDLGHPEALSPFVGSHAVDMADGCVNRRHALIADACRELLESMERATQPL